MLQIYSNISKPNNYEAVNVSFSGNSLQTRTNEIYLLLDLFKWPKFGSTIQNTNIFIRTTMKQVLSQSLGNGNYLCKHGEGRGRKEIFTNAY